MKYLREYYKRGRVPEKRRKSSDREKAVEKGSPS